MLSYKSAPRRCGYCRRQVLAEHLHQASGVHLLLSMLTCGAWFPVYLLLLLVGRYRCPRCGSWV